MVEEGWGEGEIGQSPAKVISKKTPTCRPNEAQRNPGLEVSIYSKPGFR